MTDHPTAPVQDDDAELVAFLREEAAHYDKTIYKDTVRKFTAAADRLSRLSPTPETGLVEAAMREALPVLEEMAQGRGTREQIVIVAQTLSKLIRASLSNVLPDEV